MNQQDLYCRLINKLLNQFMRKKYNYDFVFYLNPVQHLINLELNSDYYSIEEITNISCGKSHAQNKEFWQNKKRFLSLFFKNESLYIK